MKDRFQSLYHGLGYRFQQDSLLAEALTHRSAGNPNNERFEFLGDALLNWVIADELCRLQPRASEGDLTRLRASLVREPALAEIAQTLELGECLKLGPGEQRSGGFRRQSILADALEAVLAAIYLDGGIESARNVILHLYGKSLVQLPDAESLKDAKTRLQEFLQGRGLPLPVYEVIEITGQAHLQQFHVRCAVPEVAQQAEGEGGSRRQAEQSAAARMLDQLKVSV
ncbi:MAG: ribonuclease III [Nevskiales bacterium]